MSNLNINSTNTILYCKKWQETVYFYMDLLKFPVTFSSDWFVEFKLADSAHLSIADEKRATVKSVKGDGVTLALQVENIHEAWQFLHETGLSPGPIKEHAWGAEVFYFFDPEGHRIEAWSS